MPTETNPLTSLMKHRSSSPNVTMNPGLAHFGILFWPTSGTLKFWESFIPVVVAAVGMWESLVSDFQGLWEGWENSLIVFPCFP
jgi:hypothetical protein